MGLLGEDIDPKTQGLLALGFGLLNSRGNLGQAIGQAGPQAMQAYSQANDAIQRKRQQEQAMQAQALQMQMSQQQMAEMQRQAKERERQQQFLQGLQSPQMAAAGQALAGGGGPTVANAAKMPAVDPMQQIMLQAVKAGVMPVPAYLQSLQKDTSPLTVKEGETLLDRKTMKPVYSAPKAQELPAQVREYEYAKQQGYGGTFQQFVTEQKRAGATNVSVSMDKGFGDAFAKDAAGSLATSRDQARAASNTIGTLDRISSTLDSGKVALGPTAKFELFGRQLAESTGLGGKDNAEKLQNTRKMIQGAASLAVDGAAALRGQGQITEGERALVSRAAGGDIDSMTAPEVRALVGVLRKINVGRIEQHKAQLGNVGKQFAPFVPFYNVDVPPAQDGWGITPVGR